MSRRAPVRRPSPPLKSQARERERPVREDLITQACLEAYGAVRRDGRLADRALDFTLRHKTNLYARERRLVAERVYALLRRQRTVEALLERVRPGVDRLPASRQDALRLAASRVLEGESVSRVLHGTGVLSADVEALHAIPEAARVMKEGASAPDQFAVWASLPDFIAEKFLAAFGAEAPRAAEAMNARAPLFARVNTLKADRAALIRELSREGVSAHATTLSPLGVELETRINAFSLDAFKRGLFELQDEGSQLLGMLVDPPPTRVVDACAGAGGKALQLSAEMKNRGELFALDIDEGRLEELRKRARRDGVHNVRVPVLPEDSAAVEEALRDLEGRADRVLVDAPCSGSGTFRRKPDARYRLTPESLQAHVERQRRLLHQFSALVKPGGRLVYGTCSVFRDENEDVVEAFLNEHPAFEVLPVKDVLGEALGQRVSPDGRFLRLSPHLQGTDGFFGAVLKKTC